LKGGRGRGTLEKEKPPIFGMIERGGQVVIRMLVQQATIHPIIEKPKARTSISCSGQNPKLIRVDDAKVI
jgi:hypothetical protein